MSTSAILDFPSFEISTILLQVFKTGKCCYPRTILKCSPHALFFAFGPRLTLVKTSWQLCECACGKAKTRKSFANFSAILSEPYSQKPRFFSSFLLSRLSVYAGASKVPPRIFGRQGQNVLHKFCIFEGRGRGGGPLISVLDTNIVGSLRLKRAIRHFKYSFIMSRYTDFRRFKKHELSLKFENA